KQPAHPCDPRVRGRGLQRTESSVRIDDHRPEFPGPEPCSEAANTLLPIEDRAAIVELDQHGDRDPQRTRQCEPEPGQGDVERAFHDVPPESIVMASIIINAPPRRRSDTSRRRATQVT